MKKIFNSIVAFLLVAILAIGLISCSASENFSKGDASPSDNAYIEMSDGSNGSSSTNYSDGTKIIKTANVSAEAKEYSEATEELKALISELGGHISNSTVNENASYRTDGKKEKTAKYTIKVPSEQFDSFISELSEIFNVTSLSTATEDVSESYFTLQARVTTLEAKREGLVNMLKNVDVNTDFTTWQKINAELTEIDVQLNSYNEQLKTLENKVAYATVALSVREVIEYTEPSEKSYGEIVLDAFKDSFTMVVEILKGLLIALIYLLPFIIFFGVSAIIIVVIIRSAIKKKRAKRNKLKNENNEDAK